MRYLTREDIILINKRTVERHGGNFMPPSNFLNPSTLDYLLEAVEAEMFDAPLYPSLTDKAGFYMFNIISNHMFSDGNKRTGLGAGLVFLRLNGYRLNDNLDMLDIFSTENLSRDKILTDIILEVASGKVDLPTCQQWFEQNVTL